MSVYNSLKEALKNKEDVTSLDLSAQGLNTFPFEIYEFPNLKELDLSNNKIRIISNSRIFGRDRRYNTTFRLSSLDLSNNRICKIDWYILRCMGLESLNLNNNFISVDYEEILPMYSAGQIMDIPKISLSNNLIYGNFRFCVRQTEVDLSNNFLSGSLYDAGYYYQDNMSSYRGFVYSQRNLVKLNLSNNLFKIQLMEEIFNEGLQSLEYVNLSNNRFTGYKHYTNYKFARNTFVEWDYGLEALDKLTYFNIENNIYDNASVDYIKGVIKNKNCVILAEKQRGRYNTYHTLKQVVCLIKKCLIRFLYLPFLSKIRLLIIYILIIWTVVFLFFQLFLA